MQCLNAKVFARNTFLKYIGIIPLIISSAPATAYCKDGLMTHDQHYVQLHVSENATSITDQAAGASEKFLNWPCLKRKFILAIINGT